MCVGHFAGIWRIESSYKIVTVITVIVMSIGPVVPAPVQLSPPSHLHPHVLSFTGDNYSSPNVLVNNVDKCQVIFYIAHSHLISDLVTDPVLSSQAPVCSLLIYNPARRHEVWRFLTYQFVHVNMEHIVFNTLMQIVVGLPLEMSQPGYHGTIK